MTKVKRKERRHKEVNFVSMSEEQLREKDGGGETKGRGEWRERMEGKEEGEEKQRGSILSPCTRSSNNNSRSGRRRNRRRARKRIGKEGESKNMRRQEPIQRNGALSAHVTPPSLPIHECIYF